MKRDKYDATFSEYIRLRDGFKCQRCGRQYDQYDRRGAMGLHCSHYMGRTNQATRYDEENAEALCHGCHRFFEDRKQTYYRDFKIRQLGRSRLLALERRSRAVKKWKPGEKDQLREDYKKKIKQLM
jgi:5-methylcytosine-specific restriction endonuclease McrA